MALGKGNSNAPDFHCGPATLAKVDLGAFGMAVFQTNVQHVAGHNLCPV